MNDNQNTWVRFQDQDPPDGIPVLIRIQRSEWSSTFDVAEYDRHEYTFIKYADGTKSNPLINGGTVTHWMLIPAISK